MASLHLPDDVERQTAQESPGRASSTSDYKVLRASPPFGLDLELPYKNTECLSDRTAQCCFLCLQGRKSGQYAVLIPCFRPTKPRRVISRRLSPKVSESGVTRYEKVPGGETYEKLSSKENACESDAAIYHRLKETCFQYQGKWKRWIPFYGIVDVREVKFEFGGLAERDGRFPIRIYPINIDQVLEKADRIIALEPDDSDLSGVCVDENWHSIECQDTMDMWGVPCIKDQIKAARQQKRKLDVLYLLRDCARNPWKANGLRTLEGMAQESCILDTDRIIVPGYQQLYDWSDGLCGIQFVLGLQFDRIAYEVPLGMAWACFSLAVIWLCVIAWGGSMGDWATAMAFGQLLVASISLPFLYARN